MFKRCEILNKFYEFFMKKVPGPTRILGESVYIKGKETILKVNKDGSKYVKTEIIKL
jgi:hypothetical protein